MEASDKGESRPKKKQKIQRLITDFAQFVQAGKQFLQTYAEISEDAIQPSAVEDLESLERSLTNLSQQELELTEYKRELTSMTLSPSEWASFVRNREDSTTLSAGPDISFTRSASETLFNALQHYLDGLQSYIDKQAGSGDDTLPFKLELDISEEFVPQKTEESFDKHFPNVPPIERTSSIDYGSDGLISADEMPLETSGSSTASGDGLQLRFATPYPPITHRMLGAFDSEHRDDTNTNAQPP